MKCFIATEKQKLHARIVLMAIIRLQLHGAIYRPDSFVLMLRYCANLKAIRYESTTLNGIVADKSHRVIVALEMFHDPGDVRMPLFTTKERTPNCSDL